MNTKYDLIIVGAGPAGIFAALEYNRLNRGKKVLIIEKGRRIEKRKCPKRNTGICENCKPCNITSGFSGAGAFSDGKLILSPDIGGYLKDYLPDNQLSELIKYTDEIYLSYGADKTVFGIHETETLKKLRQNAIKSNLKFIESPIRHIGTEESYRLYSRIQEELLNRGIEISFNNPVSDFIIHDDIIKGVVADKDYYSDNVIVSVGREGADWFKKISVKYGIETVVGGVDIGVRVEVRNEIMQEINDELYESKLIYYTPTFDDRVRTFCHNPSGVVATEYYDGDLAVVNGHSYKSGDYKTENTNFALLVSNYFTDPFKEPIEYGKYIARLGNLLSGNKIIVQRFGDLKRGRRTTVKRLKRNNIQPTLIDAVPGDLSLVLPYRIMLDIKEMIEALDNIFHGIVSDETLIYGIEVKFYSNIIKVSGNFESSVKGLYAAGDGAGITRSLMQASINGVILGRIIR